MMAGMAVILTALFLGFMLLNILYKRTNAYKNIQALFKKFKVVPENLEMVNVGSGPSYYGFDYEYLPVRGYNFAIPPQSVYHDYALLSHYKEKIQKGAVIFIAVTCPLSFAKNKFHRKKGYRCRYYGTLFPKEVDGGSRWEAFLFFHFPLSLFPKQAYRVFCDVPPAKPLNQEENIKKEAEHMLAGWIQNNDVRNLKDAEQAGQHRKEADRVTGMYRKMLELCREQGWKPCFVIPPVSRPIREMVSPEFKQKFVTDNISKANFCKAPVLDYFSDERVAEDSYFLNSMFLNEKGRRKFMGIFWKDLKDLEVF